MYAGSRWMLAGHLIGVLLWIGGLMTVYWLQRLQAQSPSEGRDRLGAMQRSLALMADISAALAIGCGIAMLVHPNNMFAMPNMGWLHGKLTVIILGILPIHGMMRARIKKFSRGETPAVPQWQWSLLLAATVATVILVTTKLSGFSAT